MCSSNGRVGERREGSKGARKGEDAGIVGYRKVLKKRRQVWR